MCLCDMHIYTLLYILYRNSTYQIYDLVILFNINFYLQSVKSSVTCNTCESKSKSVIDVEIKRYTRVTFIMYMEHCSNVMVVYGGICSLTILPPAAHLLLER